MILGRDFPSLVRRDWILICICVTVLVATVGILPVPLDLVRNQVNRKVQPTVVAKQVTLLPNTVAIVDDDPNTIWLRMVSSTATQYSIQYYPNCEMLLANMDAGLRFRLYILDTHLGIGRMQGYECVESILVRHALAIIVASSAASQSEADILAIFYEDAGASTFVNKFNVDGMEMVLKQLLNLY